MTDHPTNGLRGQSPNDQEVAGRLATVKVGIWLTVIVTLGAQVYAFATWDQPNRPLISAVLVVALLSAIVIALLPMERIIRSRWREPLFLGWSSADILLIAVTVAADGGTKSPYTLLFVLPFLFGAFSYPLALTAAVGVIDIAAFIAVAAAAGGGLLYSAFAGFALCCAALLSSWEARNQAERRRELARAAEALQTSEETSRLQAEQQEEVARFGQIALGGADIELLLNEAAAVLQRVLRVEIAAVMRLVPEEQAFVVEAGAGIPAEALGRERVPGGVESQAGYTLSTGTPVIVEDWAQEDRFSQPELLARAGMVSGVTVLIRAKGQPYGVLGAQTSHRRTFGSDVVNFMQAIANILANAIERRGAEERTRFEALHDPLTGLPNRNLFIDRLRHALAHARRRDASVAVLFLDLDQFKVVNDSLGHAVGDELLAAVAPRLEEACRPSDTVARFGGDEFAVLAEDVGNVRGATRVAERIERAFHVPFAVREREHFVSASIGIAIGDGSEAPESLVRDADAALYRAKERGRGGHEVFDADLRARVLEHMRVENDLRRALERDELELHYQPVVALRDASTVALEALLRWRHPDRGVVGPAAFVPGAEETLLIVPIGRWVIEEACRQAAAWQSLDPDAAPVGVAVNLSARQLTDPELTKVVSEALEDSGIEPTTLNLELTESVLLEEVEIAERTLHSLKELGVRLVLDDFGTGFSSLGYLRRIPLDAIKLDRSFIEGLVGGSTEVAIVRAVVEMAGALGLEVVAEGVESADQLEAVRSLGCGHAQGFYFARPVPASEVPDLLRRPTWIDATRA